MQQRTNVLGQQCIAEPAQQCRGEAHVRNDVGRTGEDADREGPGNGTPTMVMNTMTVRPSAQHSRKMPRTYFPSASSRSASTASAGSKSRFGTVLNRPRLISPVSPNRNRNISGAIIQVERMWPSSEDCSSPRMSARGSAGSPSSVGRVTPSHGRARVSSSSALARS